MAVGEAAILLHHPPPVAGVRIGTVRGCQQSEPLADGGARREWTPRHHPLFPTPPARYPTYPEYLPATPAVGEAAILPHLASPFNSGVINAGVSKMTGISRTAIRPRRRWRTRGHKLGWSRWWRGAGSCRFPAQGHDALSRSLLRNLLKGDGGAAE